MTADTERMTPTSRLSLSFVLATALASVACMPPSTAHDAEASTGEWVSGSVDLKKVTAVVRVTPPSRLKASFEDMAARSDDEDFGAFLRARASGGFGSGFVMIHRSGASTRAFVVTNRHVVADSTEAEVSFSDGTTYKACEIVFVSDKHDLAVVALPDSAVKVFDHGLRPRAEEISERLNVVATGYPGLGGAPSYQVTDGKVSNAHFSMPERGFEEPLLQHTAPIDPGSSGGPLTDENGRLVGVNVALARGRSSMFFAVPAAAVAETVRKAHELTTERASSAWMKGELEHACAALSAELSSTSPSTPRLMSFVSNELIADEGIASYLFVTTRTKAAPSLRRAFYEDPMFALRASVTVRLAIRAELAGGSAGACARVNAADERDIDATKTVRLALKGRKGDVELRWRFEHGSWRVAGGDLIDVRAVLAQDETEEEPAHPAKVATKTGGKVK